MNTKTIYWIIGIIIIFIIASQYLQRKEMIVECEPNTCGGTQTNIDEKGCPIYTYQTTWSGSCSATNKDDKTCNVGDQCPGGTYSVSSCLACYGGSCREDYKLYDDQHCFCDSITGSNGGCSNSRSWGGTYGYCSCRATVQCSTSQTCGGWFCSETWDCTDWTPIQCPITEFQTRTCVDTHECGTTVSKPEESRTCTYICIEEWNCGSWTPTICDSTLTQTRTCTDVNVCGTETYKPELTRSCVCQPVWQCTNWDPLECTESQTQTRTCTDTNNCGVTEGKPEETRTCSFCSESWTCTQWSECLNGEQTRTCADANTCGTTYDKPSEEQTCICTEDWLCGEWTDCLNNKQTRTCSDSNNCGTTYDKPNIERECTIIPDLECIDTSYFTCPNKEDFSRSELCNCSDGIWDCHKKTLQQLQDTYCTEEISHDLWWFDDETLECGKKEFIGTFTYEGLRTFQTLDECIKTLDEKIKGEQKPDYTTITIIVIIASAIIYFIIKKQKNVK